MIFINKIPLKKKGKRTSGNTPGSILKSYDDSNEKLEAVIWSWAVEEKGSVKILPEALEKNPAKFFSVRKNTRCGKNPFNDYSELFWTVFFKHFQMFPVTQKQ